MNKLGAALYLLWRFPVEVVLSGWSTGWLIVSGGRRLQPGFARMDYGEISEIGAVMLGLLITLTPGTTTVEVDSTRRELLLHVLDIRDVEGVLDTIRQRFVRPIGVLFGEKS
jgi:multisubunit Na+/H+ antiporter MnhE subunit